MSPLSLRRSRAGRRRASVLAGGAAVALTGVAAGLAGAAAGARRGRREVITRTPEQVATPAAALDPPAPSPLHPADTALDGLVRGTLGSLTPPAHVADQALLGSNVADAYRAARQAFGHAGEAMDDEALGRLREAAMTLWCCATFAEPFAADQGKWLARRSRELVCLIDERRDLDSLVEATLRRDDALGSGALVEIEAFADRRRRRLERRIVDRGKRLFAAKPARVARRIAEDGPQGRSAR